jgi:acyl-CoA reductase-like NAD-dependent aldehyde dehydrogenase
MVEARRSIGYFYIGGRRVAPATDDIIEVVSPHSEEVIATVPAASNADVDAAVCAANSAMTAAEWGGVSVATRLSIVKRFADEYEKLASDLGRAMTEEMGCPASLVQVMHINPAIRALRYYISVAERYPFEERRNGARSTLVLRRPVGVVAAVIPWNGPVFLAMLKLAPALVAGCATVLKASPEAPLSSYVLARAAEAAELPPGVVNVLAADRAVSEYLVTHPGVQKVSFTGSTRAGQRVAQLCGQQLKRFNLELGGKSAAIILDDADVAAAAKTLQMASFANSGQVCTARTRILAPRSRYEEVVSTIAETARSLRVGDPADPATEIGPLALKRQRDTVLEYIKIGIQEGARLVTGGSPPAGRSSGFYIQPTVFADVSNSMRIAQEEIFGPVVCVMRYEDEEEAVRLANDSVFGLSGSVFTSDLSRGLGIARRIQSGTFAINTFGNDVSAPFGGVKLSGIGREMGLEGLEGYFEYRSILLPANCPEDFPRSLLGNATAT